MLFESQIIQDLSEPELSSLGSSSESLSLPYLFSYTLFHFGKTLITRTGTYLLCISV
jgi:hypothetical protein